MASNPNNAQMDMLMGNDDDDSQGPMPAPAPSAGTGQKMISLQLPVEVGQMLMDAIGQQLSQSQPATLDQNAQPEDLTAPQSGEDADETQFQGE